MQCDAFYVKTKAARDCKNVEALTQSSLMFAFAILSGKLKERVFHYSKEKIIHRPLIMIPQVTKNYFHQVLIQKPI